MRRVKILGMGRYLPQRVVTNDDLATMVDTSDEWIRERTGISSRRFAEETTATSDLAAKAIEGACAEAGMEPSELDAIIVGTCSPDAIFPSTACWTQGKLGINRMPAFDVMAGCSSWLYGLEVASHWLAGDPTKKIAVCGAEVFSKLLDFKDRRTCVLFGDGAGAAILTGGDGASGILASNWGSDGTFASILSIPAGGSRMPASHGTVDEGKHFVYMEGGKVFKHAVQEMSTGLVNALADAGVEQEDVDWLIPHQANIRIMDACRERTRIPKDRVQSVLAKYGNISAASIPVALCEARQAGHVQPGQTIAMTAFGTGLTWAAAVLKM